MSKRPWWLLPHGRIHPLWWIALGAVMLWVDFLSGPAAQVPVIYVLPVSFAAWYSGKWPALTLAIAVPLLRLVFLAAAPGPFDHSTSMALTTLLRGAVI